MSIRNYSGNWNKWIANIERNPLIFSSINKFNIETETFTKYYDKDGNATTKDDYAKNCLNEIKKCTEYADGTYSDSKGNIVSKDEYYKSCGVVDNPKTGSFLSGLVVIAGSLLLYAISYYISKHGKLYKIN